MDKYLNLFWNLSDNLYDQEQLQERTRHCLWRPKYITLPPTKQRQGQKQLYIHPHETLYGKLKGFYIKGYEVNWDSR